MKEESKIKVKAQKDKWKWIITAVSVLLLCLVIAGTLYTFYDAGKDVMTAHCLSAEHSENQIIFREQDVDYDFYGATDIYYVLQDDVAAQFNKMEKEKQINVEKGFYMKFFYNSISDYKRKDEVVYFNVKEVIDMSHNASGLK